MQRSTEVGGLANARDLGGLRRADGSTTPTGVFLRAETLDRVETSGWDALRALGVRTIVDLRRPEEVSYDAPSGIDLVRVDLDGDEREFWEPLEGDGRWGTPLYYAAHVKELPHRLHDVIRAIASAQDGALLFHCAAGWDRTGLVAAFLLKALGVTSDAATEDYLASFANAERMAALHGRSFEVDERLGVLARFGHTPDSAFRTMYEDLDVDEWFRRAQADDQTREAVRTWRGSTVLQDREPVDLRRRVDFRSET